MGFEIYLNPLFFFRFLLLYLFQKGIYVNSLPLHLINTMLIIEFRHNFTEIEDSTYRKIYFNIIQKNLSHLFSNFCQTS